MRDPSDIIRIWLYNTLNGAITYRSATVPVYAFAPKNAAKPFILIASQSMSSELDESTKNSYITKHSVTLEVYDAYTGNDGSFRGINSITNDMLALVRTRSEIPMTGYDVISCVVDSTLTNSIDNGVEIVFFKIVNITLTVEDLKPEAPVLADSTTGTSTSFYANWSSVPEADGYYLDVATDAAFTTFLSGFENKSVGNVLTYEVTSVLTDIPYYVRVRASRSSTMSDNSNTKTTTIYSEWYLPTSGMMYYIVENLDKQSIITLANTTYWTSTEQNATTAVVYDNRDDTYYALSKSTSSYVLPCRRFTALTSAYDIGDAGPAGGYICHKDVGSPNSVYWEVLSTAIDTNDQWSNQTSLLIGVTESSYLSTPDSTVLIAGSSTSGAAVTCNDYILILNS